MSCSLHDTIREMGLMSVNEGDAAQRQLLISPHAKELQCACVKAKRIACCHSSQQSLWPDGMEAPNLEAFISRESRLTAVPKALFSASYLYVIDISFSGVQSVPPAIHQLPTLRLLRLDGCHQIEALPMEISGLQGLMVLSLRLCASLKIVPNTIESLSTVQCMFLCGCGFESLPPTLGNLPKLRELDLSFCDELKELPSATLSHLDHSSF